MMNSVPTVSVVIPTYNRSTMLREALESVCYQTVKDLEVIVVDDGSTDETAAVVRSFGPWAIYLRQDRLGVAAARNRGIQASRGRYIAFLDSDDLWLPHKLERQLDHLRAHPEVGLLYARMWSYDVETPQQRQLEPRTIARSFDELLNGYNAVTTSTVIVRRECLELVGLFNASMPAVEDYDLWLRVARRFAIAVLDEPLAEYRRHSRSTTKEPARLYEGYRRFYELLLQEYRPYLRSPRSAERHLAKFQYLSGTAALRQGEARRALRLIGRALTQDVGLGGQFVKENASWRQRLWLPIKPYAALVVSGVKCLRA